MKRCVSLLLAGMGYCALAQAATPNADGGRVDFLGKITVYRPVVYRAFLPVSVQDYLRRG